MEEIQQLQRRLNEQVLERAEADPEWRRHYIEDPETATSAFPEAQRLWEMYESTQLRDDPPEATIPIAARQEHTRLERSLAEKILDRAATDPSWKQQLLDEPQAALRTANFPEVQRLEEMGRSVLGTQEGAEVRGQQEDLSGLSGSGVYPDPNPTCRRRTLYNEYCIP